MGACYSAPDEADEAAEVARRLAASPPAPLPSHVLVAASGQSEVYSNGGALVVVGPSEATSGRDDVIAIVGSKR